MKKVKVDEKKLTIESFGEVMDQFLDQNDIQMILESEAGEHDYKIRDNTGLGPVVQLYILTNAFSSVVVDMIHMLEKDGIEFDFESFSKELFDVVKRDVLEKVREKKGEKNDK